MSRKSYSKPTGNRIRAFKFLIEALDSARIGDAKNIEKIDLVIQDLNLKKTTTLDWENVLNEVKYISEIPKRDKAYSLILKLNKIISFLTILSFLGLIVMALAFYTIKNFLIYNLSIIITLISVNLIYIIRFYISMKINKVYLSHIDELEIHGKILRDAVNILLPRLRSELKKNKISLDDFVLELKLTDYQWIKIKKKPSFLRSGYKVTFSK